MPNFISDSAEDRTPDPLIKSQLLYQLSYKVEGANILLMCFRINDLRDFMGIFYFLNDYYTKAYFNLFKPFACKLLARDLSL